MSQPRAYEHDPSLPDPPPWELRAQFRSWQAQYAALVRHIFENVAPRFKDRAGGYTRIVKLGKARIGDGGELCLIQFVGAEDGPEIGGRPSTRRRAADRRTAFAAKVRKAAAEKPAEKPAEKAA